MFVLSKLVWTVLEPSTALTLLALAGVALCYTRFAFAGRRLALVAGLGLLIAGFSPLGTALLRPLEERFPAFQDDGSPVAGVIVLGGALTAEVTQARGQMTFNEAGERLVAMADLARRHPEAKIVFSGGSGDVTGLIAPEGEVLRSVLATLMAPERVLFESLSRNTAENAAFTRLLVGAAGGRWLLVTSAAHMPRAVGLFRKAGLNVTAYPVDYRTTGRSDDFRPMASVSAGLRRTDVAVKEWVGLLFAYSSGQSTSLFPD